MRCRYLYDFERQPDSHQPLPLRLARGTGKEGTTLLILVVLLKESRHVA